MEYKNPDRTKMYSQPIDIHVCRLKIKKLNTDSH